MLLKRFLSIVTAVILISSTSLQAKQPSKIGIHLLSGYSTGAKKIIGAKQLPVIKVLDLSPEMRRAIVDYKKVHPEGVVVLRVWTPLHVNREESAKSRFVMPYTLEQNPRECAKDFWEHRILTQLVKATPEERKFIDYIEGPNEGSDCPTWTTMQDVRWFRDFWLTLAPLIHDAGYKPCLASIAVGNPPGSPEEIAEKLRIFSPALRLAKKLGGAWSYHSYTLKYTKDPGVEYWYSLRYRQLYEVFKKDHPDLVDMKMILTEGGVDDVGDRLKSGWQERGTAEKYIDWIAWFDKEINLDPYIVGVTLFQIGDDWWKSFNLEPMADKVAGYLNS